MTMNSEPTTSTRPYLVRALYEWCTDNGLTPYVAVLVDDSVKVPREYVKDGEIVLNISFDATQALKLGNDFIQFKARFAGVARDICVPMERVVAIYARENGQGMAFPHPVAGTSDAAVSAGPGLVALDRSVPDGTSAEESPRDAAPVEAGAPPTEPPRPPTGSRPSLKRVK